MSGSAPHPGVWKMVLRSVLALVRSLVLAFLVKWEVGQWTEAAKSSATVVTEEASSPRWQKQRLKPHISQSLSERINILKELHLVFCGHCMKKRSFLVKPVRCRVLCSHNLVLSLMTVNQESSKPEEQGQRKGAFIFIYLFIYLFICIFVTLGQMRPKHAC